MKTRRKTLLTAIAAGAGLVLGAHAASAQHAHRRSRKSKSSRSWRAPIAPPPIAPTICAASRSRCWSSSASVPASSRSISAPPAATRRSCWPVRSDLPARFTARAGRAIPTGRRHRLPRQRATATRPRAGRGPGAAAGAPRPSPVALADRDAGSAKPASRPRRSSPSSRPFEDPVPPELARSRSIW